MRTTRWALLPSSALALCWVISCSKEERESENQAVASKSAAAAPQGAQQPSPHEKLNETPPPGKVLGQAGRALGHPHPVGPPLLLAAGESLGPIRAGTNLETLARHMEGPCDLRSEQRCIYVKQAVELTLDDGIVVGIKVHRRDRLVPGSPSEEEHRFFGTFNGGMQPKLMLGLHQHIVLEEYGEPLKKEPLSGNNGEVERHVYEGIVFEYDRIDNGNTVLSAMELVLPAPPPGPGSGAPEPSVPSAETPAP